MPPTTLPLSEAAAAPSLRFSGVRLPNGIRLRYAEQGDPGGRPLVLLHGYSDSWFSFSPVLPLLPPTCRAFALDQRGHGDSDRPEGGYALRDLAADVVAFMDAVGLERAMVVGHSMGGLVAQQVALIAPERVEGLVLVGTAPSIHAFEGADELERAVAGLEDPVPEDFLWEFQASTVYRPLPAAFMDRVVTESRKLPARTWRALMKGMLDTPPQGRLSASLPALVLWGEEDLYTQRSAQEALLALLPLATLTVYPETGHALHWERPEAFARDLAAFVASIPA